MRRSRIAAVLAATSLLGLLLAFVSPAGAQTGYPPGPCTVLTGSQFAGNANVGQTFTVTVTPTCTFTAGGTATVVVNGTSFTKVVKANGTVTITITVVSATQLSIDDPILVPAQCGINTISVTAPSAVANGQNVTQVVTFSVNCPGVPPVSICNAGNGGAGGSGLGAGGDASANGGTA